MRHVKNENISKMKDFIKTHPGAPNCQQKGLSPLLLAVKLGFSEMVLYLVNKGARLTFRDNNGCNALHLSALSKNAPMTHILVNLIERAGKKSLINRQDNNKKTTFVLCSR